MHQGYQQPRKTEYDPSRSQNLHHQQKGGSHEQKHNNHAKPQGGSPSRSHEIKSHSASVNQSREEEFKALMIPANWELAEKHGRARSVGKPKDSAEQESCPCCGYEIERDQLDYCSSTRQLSFLGSGFPLFYNFILYCIMMLLSLFICKGGFNLVTNEFGDFCNGKNRNQKGQTCPDTWIHRASLANKLNRPDLIEFQSNFNILVLVVTCALLFYFRKSQRMIDKEIDDELVTPADFTIMVKNVPRGLDVNYKSELQKIFTFYACPESDSRIEVTKVVLVYDIESLIEKEEELKKIVQKKQKVLKENRMNFKDPLVKDLDEKIEEMEEIIERLDMNIQHDGNKFSGIAFVSFLTENMKDEVLKNNEHTLSERIAAYMNRGRSEALTYNDLSWLDHKLFLSPAPEPNDVDWEFVHITTTQKLKWRMASWGISIGFMISCFLIIYSLSSWADSLNDWAEEHRREINEWTYIKIDLISGSISWVIVLFNKFIMGVTYHHIVDSERISSKTKFNIQFAIKLTIALFINTAMMSYIIDIVLMGNIITKGGFIQNETQVFILNALFPPFVWFIDPYNLLQVWKRNRELKNKALSVVTQQEANILMEKTEYYQAKRYADIMKTMWFTFLFGSAIPLGIVLSIVGLIMYFWIDKYNVMRRRTVKENLAKEVSIEMIEMLELSIIFCGVGNMTMSYSFFSVIHWQDLVVFFVGIIYAMLPMQEINDYIFQIEENAEETSYDQACHKFVTDYDRENPVTKKQALEEWRKHQLAFKKSKPALPAKD